MAALSSMQGYESYKDSGVDRIGEIPVGWTVEKLKYCTVINENSLAETTSAKLLIQYVDIGSVSLEKGIRNTEEFTFADAPSRARRLAKTGDTVVSTVRTYLKAISYVNKINSDCVFSTGFAVLSPKYGLDSKYLSNFIKSNSFTEQVDEVAKGMSYPAINSTELSNLFLVKAPQKIQRNISNFLDKKTAQIDEAIAIKEKQIELLKERTQIIIQQAVTQGLNSEVPMKDSGVAWVGEVPKGWKVESLKNVLFERNQKNSPVVSTERLSLSIDKGITLYSEKTTNLDRFKDDFSQYKIAHEGDLVFNSMNMIVGAVGVSAYFGCVSPVYYTYYARVDNPNITKYYEYFFKTKVVQSQLYGLGKGIMAIDRGDGKFNTLRLKVSRDDLRSMKVPYPTISEINDIVDYIEQESDKINRAIELHEQQIAKLKEYKTTLINSAVTGKIKVPEVESEIY